MHIKVVYACGNNQFNQLRSHIHGNDLDEETDTINKPHPVLKLNENECFSQGNFTWSRFVYSKRNKAKDFSSTYVSGHFNDSYHPSSRVYKSSYVFPMLEIFAVTDKDIFLTQSMQVLPVEHLSDGKCFTTKVKMSQLKKKVISASGDHDNIIVSYDNINIGKIEKFIEKNQKENNFELVSIDSGISITSISCGKEHSVMMSKHGSVYTYGIGSRGQLGHNDLEGLSSPRLVEALAGVKVAAVAAGGWHSAAVTECGQLYTWGWNESGQLGLPATDLHRNSDDEMDKNSQPHNNKERGEAVALQPEPTCPLPDDTPDVTQVACGSRHTLILLDTGEVLSCGYNGAGQLGLGHLASVDVFTPMDLPGLCLRVTAAQWNSLFLLEMESKTFEDNTVSLSQKDDHQAEEVQTHEEESS